MENKKLMYLSSEKTQTGLFLKHEWKGNSWQQGFLEDYNAVIVS